MKCTFLITRTQTTEQNINTVIQTIVMWLRLKFIMKSVITICMLLLPGKLTRLNTGIQTLKMCNNLVVNHDEQNLALYIMLFMMHIFSVCTLMLHVNSVLTHWKDDCNDLHCMMSFYTVGFSPNDSQVTRTCQCHTLGIFIWPRRK